MILVPNARIYLRRRNATAACRVRQGVLEHLHGALLSVRLRIESELIMHKDSVIFEDRHWVPGDLIVGREEREERGVGRLQERVGEVVWSRTGYPFCCLR